MGLCSAISAESLYCSLSADATRCFEVEVVCVPSTFQGESVCVPVGVCELSDSQQSCDADYRCRVQSHVSQCSMCTSVMRMAHRGTAFFRSPLEQVRVCHQGILCCTAHLVLLPGGVGKRPGASQLAPFTCSGVVWGEGESLSDTPAGDHPHHDLPLVRRAKPRVPPHGGPPPPRPEAHAHVRRRSQVVCRRRSLRPHAQLRPRSQRHVAGARGVRVRRATYRVDSKVTQLWYSMAGFPRRPHCRLQQPSGGQDVFAHIVVDDRQGQTHGHIHSPRRAPQHYHRLRGPRIIPQRPEVRRPHGWPSMRRSSASHRTPST